MLGVRRNEPEQDFGELSRAVRDSGAIYTETLETHFEGAKAELDQQAITGYTIAGKVRKLEKGVLQ